MGYRSDVKLAFYCENKGDNLAKLEAWVNDKLKDESEYSQRIECGSLQGIMFVWEWIKWYEDYPEIAKIIQAMDEFGNTLAGDDFMYEFIRIGEEDNDVERQDCNTAHGLLSVRRTIELCEF